MKFLLFNVSVICALCYLFSGSEGVNPRAIKTKVSEVINGSLVQNSHVELGKIIEATPVAPLKTMKPIIQHNGAETLENTKKNSEPHNSLDEKPENNFTKQDLSIDPSKTDDSGNKLLDSADIYQNSITASPSTLKIMSPRERRRELNKLAEDMELIFVSKFTK